MTPPRCARQPHRAQVGASLLMVLAFVGLSSLLCAALLRDAAASQWLSTQLHMDRLAQQMAELGLRHCEQSLLLAEDERVPTLQEARIDAASVAGGLKWSGTGWEGLLRWQMGHPHASASLSSVPTELLVTGDVSAAAHGWPQPLCMVERYTLPSSAGGSTDSYLVTARGFSPDHIADAEGKTQAGSAVWVQSILSIRPAQ